MKLKLANYWKKIAGIILLLAITFLVINKIYNFNIAKSTLASFGKISFTLAGLLFIMSKEKVEDEYIMNIRLQSFSFCFLLGIIAYMIDESGLLNFLGGENPRDMFRYILIEMFTYILFFYAMLYRIIKFEK
ncbi:MAG: hypothetical protein JWO92_2396 [Chitinophagaceae bacterium]|nr:hypothetical protein [Chitinophagaceae bacterium]MDB5221789.1 hypothetical protein [Chitinophagaceae bacterium]